MMHRMALATLVATMSAAMLGASSPAEPTAAHALPRGHVLTRADIVYPADSAMPGQVLPGWTTQRVIAAGSPLRPPAVRPPALVRANAPVAIVYDGGGVRIAIAGVATRDAALGERVAARVAGTTGLTRRLEGTVTAPATITLGAR